MKTGKLNKWLLVFMVFFGLVLGWSAQTTSVRADMPDPPTGATAPSPPGRNWSFGIIYGVPANGLLSQPISQNLVATSGGTMTANFHLRVTNIQQWGLIPSQKVNAVAFQRYDNGWNDNFTDAASFEVGTTQSSTDLNVVMGGIPTVPGTYYYQMRVGFTNKSPAVVYSEIFSITVVPTPVNATEVLPEASPSTVLWGQNTTLHANLQPRDSTATVAWSTMPPAGMTDSLSSPAGLTTVLKTANPSPQSDNATNNAFWTSDGTPSGVKATATNPDGSVVTGNTTVTLGGLHPLTVEKGEGINLKPAALNNVTYPSDPTFSWRIYDQQKRRYTPKSNENATLNTDTLEWRNVQGSSSQMYYQLVVSFPNSKGTDYWYSNIAPLEIVTTKKDPTLIAVPDLQFKLSSGQDPTIEQFWQPGGVTLNYVTPQSITSPTYDGNDAGLIAVGGKNIPWNLSVAFSPFKNESGKDLSPDVVGATTIWLRLSDNTQFELHDNNRANQIADETMTGFSANVLASTTLEIPELPNVHAGTYQSTATWTLTKAP